MSAKISATRRAVFLKALGESGNITVSAERAKVSRRWVEVARKSDAAFDGACRAAIREARHRLSAAGARKPPPGWGYRDGAELVVRGTGGSSGGRRVQIARARLHQWSPRVEARFLTTLAASCNVKAACSEAGMSKGSAYGHRKRFPAFARRWDEAVAIGYARIEAALIENACSFLSPPEAADELPPELPMVGMTVRQAIHLLHMHKREVRGVGRRPGVRGRAS